MLHVQLDAYVPVVKYVHSLINQGEQKYLTGPDTCTSDKCWTISVTGHSLGGGIATIVGTTLGIPVIYCILCPY